MKGMKIKRKRSMIKEKVRFKIVNDYIGNETGKELIKMNYTVRVIRE